MRHEDTPRVQGTRRGLFPHASLALTLGASLGALVFLPDRVLIFLAVGLAAVAFLWLALKRPLYGLLALTVVAPLTGLSALIYRNAGLSAISDGMVGLLLIASVVRWGRGTLRVGPWRPPVWIILAWLAYLLYLGFQIFNPVISDPLVAFYGVRALAAPTLMLFVGFYAFRRLADVRVWLWTLFITGVATALYGLKQAWFGLAPYEAWQAKVGFNYVEDSALRIFSVFNGPWSFGLFMVLVVLAGVVLFRIERRWWRRALVVVGSACCLYALLNTYARGSWVAGLVALPIALFWSQRPKNRLSWLLGAILVASVLIGVQANGGLGVESDKLPFTGALGRRVVSLLNVGSDQSFIVRRGNWDTASQISANYPLGLGPGTTEGVGGRFSTRLQFGNLVADNFYWAMIIELGWPGIFLFGLLVGTCLAQGLLIQWRLRTNAGRSIGAMALAGGVAVLVASLTTTFLTNAVLGIVFWTMLGLLFRLPTLEAVAEEPPAPPAGALPAPAGYPLGDDDPWLSPVPVQPGPPR